MLSLSRPGRLLRPSSMLHDYATAFPAQCCTALECLAFPSTALQVMTCDTSQGMRRQLRHAGCVLQYRWMAYIFAELSLLPACQGPQQQEACSHVGAPEVAHLADLPPLQFAALCEWPDRARWMGAERQETAGRPPRGQRRAPSTSSVNRLYSFRVATSAVRWMKGVRVHGPDGPPQWAISSGVRVCVVGRLPRNNPSNPDQK